MPQVNLNVILVSLLYAAITGIFNLIFAHKSQVEAWATANPKLAAILKFTRALGLDPWNLFSAAMLFFQSKLPAAQQANSPIAKAEQKKADVAKLTMGPLVLLLFCCSLPALHGCSLFTRTNAKTAAEIAHDLCVLHFSEAKPGLSIKDVEKAYCQDLDPWLYAVGDAESLGAAKAAAKAHQ